MVWILRLLRFGGRFVAQERAISAEFFLIPTDLKTFKTGQEATLIDFTNLWVRLDRNMLIVSVTFVNLHYTELASSFQTIDL